MYYLCLTIFAAHSFVRPKVQCNITTTLSCQEYEFSPISDFLRHLTSPTKVMVSYLDDFSIGLEVKFTSQYKTRKKLFCKNSFHVGMGL